MDAPWFDLQVNGFAGVDFQSEDLRAEDLERAVEALLSRRTGRILLTLVTDGIDQLCRKLERIERFRRGSARLAAVIVGYHLEGPYLSPEPGFVGAHDPALMRRPSLAEHERLAAAAGGNLRLVTLAPELPGAPELIQHLSATRVRAAIGHSNADEAAIDRAVAAGLTLCTHLGNATPQQVHRHHNVVQRLLARDELYACFIPDGIHLPPGVLKNFVRAKPREKVLFTTDAMSAAGAPPGRYSLGKIVTEVESDGVVHLPGQKGTFAGSSLTMDAAVRNVQSMAGWTAAEAEAACSVKVAQFFGLPP
jgi:N-acetylglucosamine-6-phosphate deacetylase